MILDGKLTVRIEDIASTARNALVGGPFGSNLVTRDYVESGVPVIRGQNLGLGRWISGDFAFVTEKKAKALSANWARPGDIVFTQRGTLGQVAIVPDEPFDAYVISQSQMKLSVDEKKASPLYVYYVFTSSQMQEYIRNNAITTGVPHTNLGILRDTPIPLPPLPEQRAIAHVLSTLDDKIELNRQMNQTLEQIAAALFRSWFVDFDPVRAKAAGRQPEGMDAQTAALFPDRLVVSELGEIPEGWHQVRVSDVAAINAWTLGKNDPLERIEYVDISSVSRGDIAAIQTFERGHKPSRARRRLRHGDSVLSTVRPDRGAYFLSLDPSPNLVASTGFAVASPKNIPWSFLHSALTRQEVSTYLGHVADGGAYPAVRPEIIGNLPLVIPNEAAILNAFHATCGPLFERAALNRHESCTLAQLRDTLLPRLLSGELRVPLETFVEEADSMPTPPEPALVQSRF